MTLEELFFISQTVAAVAIVTSLFYVVVQLREAQRNQRALVQQGRAFRNTTFALRQTEAEMADLLVKATSHADWASISDVQLMQLIGWTRGLVFHFEDSYLQHRDGLMDDRAFESAKSSVANILSRPALRAIWELTRGFYSRDLAAYVDQLNRETPLSLRPPADLNARFKAMVSELTVTREPEMRADV